MPLRNLVWLLLVPALVALGLAIGYSAPAPDGDYQRVRRVVDVMAEVDANFYRKLTDQEWKQFVEDMANGGLQKLDRNSEYLNAAQLKQFEAETEGSFSGVGILLTLDPVTKFLKVDHPMPGSPAYDAGIVAGDLIVRVGKESTENVTILDARKLIMGEPGTPVTLTTRRAGRNPVDQEVTVTRARVAQHPVSGVTRRHDDPARWEWFVAAGIGYVRVTGFNDLTTKELKGAVEEIERAGGRGLIIDLRDNPGGLLTQSIDVANLFLPEGKPIVGTRGRDPGKTRDFKAEKDREVFRGRPVAVLINENSASASEIVSAALQDNQRAVIVGERSYGKGSVQKLLRLGGEGENRAAVKLTTETYWRPNGQNMDRRLATKEKPDEWGVKPDIVVPMSIDEKERAAWDYYRAQWVAGKPDALGPNPPQPPQPPSPGSLFNALRAAAAPDGSPAPTVAKPVEDVQLKAAIAELKKRIGG